MGSKNIFYFRHINAIGGIESFFYYLAQKYKDWDITIYYQTGDPAQIRRLQQFVRTKRHNGEEIECENAFFNYNLDIIDKVKAKEYIQIAHGDYKAMGISPNQDKKLTRYMGVSKQVCDTYEEVTGHKTELCYNPISVPKPRKVLNLVSATRLTAEKGKKRMIALINALEAADIPYLWTIYTDDKDAIDNGNVIYCRPRLDLVKYLPAYDYLVQLSDNEGYCYSVVEALCSGVPVIVTDCPVFKELGVRDRENGFVIDFEVKNVPIQEIYKGLGEFEYHPPKDKWEKFLVPGKSTYDEDLNTTVKMRAKRQYFDVALRRTLTRGEIFTTNLPRSELLKNERLAETIEPIDGGDI